MVLISNVKKDSPAVTRIRSIVAQMIACMSANLLLLDLGMAISFATVALPELLNAKEGLSLDDNQASWFGSISFLTQPLGAVISGPIVDFFGRKKSMFLSNIPHLVAWTILYFAWNLPSLLFASALLGLGTGIMEAPINSYVGEISHQSIRGSLATLTQLFTSVGVFAMYYLGTVVNFRMAAIISIAVPLASMLFALLVPDSPIWLLARGKETDALQSLCYLRGWTTKDQVKEEFDQLTIYAKDLHRCVICWSKNLEDQSCPHQDMNLLKRWLLKVRYVMLCKATLRPLTLVIMYFFFFAICSTFPIRPNLVNFCGAFGMADDAKNAVMITGLIRFVACVLSIVMIKVLGKRKLAISAILCAALSVLALSIYGKNHLDTSVYSYDVTTFPKGHSYTPLIFLYLLTLSDGFAIPWVLLGEVFPFRSRAAAQGLAAASSYIITFIASKTFINLELGIHLWGTCLVYALFGIVGTVYLYLFLPETEGKTLEEIESFYKGEFRTFADDPMANYFKGLKRKP